MHSSRECYIFQIHFYFNPTYVLLFLEHHQDAGPKPFSPLSPLGCIYEICFFFLPTQPSLTICKNKLSTTLAFPFCKRLHNLRLDHFSLPTRLQLSDCIFHLLMAFIASLLEPCAQQEILIGSNTSVCSTFYTIKMGALRGQCLKDPDYNF